VPNVQDQNLPFLHDRVEDHITGECHTPATRLERIKASTHGRVLGKKLEVAIQPVHKSSCPVYIAAFARNVEPNAVEVRFGIS
jgi:hypothetical protein